VGDLQFGVEDKGGLYWIDPNRQSPENKLIGVNPDVYSCSENNIIHW